MFGSDSFTADRHGSLPVSRPTIESVLEMNMIAAADAAAEEAG